MKPTLEGSLETFRTDVVDVIVKKGTITKPHLSMSYVSGFVACFHMLTKLVPNMEEAQGVALLQYIEDEIKTVNDELAQLLAAKNNGVQ